MLNSAKRYKLDDNHFLNVHTVMSCKPLTGKGLEKKVKKEFDVFKIKDGQNGPDYIDYLGVFRECKVFQVNEPEHLQHNLLVWWDHYLTTQEDQAVKCMVLNDTTPVVFHIMFHSGPKAVYLIGRLQLGKYD